MLRNLPCMETLIVETPLPQHTIDFLGTLSSLYYLCLGLVDGIHDGNTPQHYGAAFSTENGRFSALSQLYFDVRRWTDADLVLTAMRRPLVSLGVEVREGESDLPADEQFLACSRMIDTISRHVCRSELTYLHLYDPFEDATHVATNLQGFFSLTSLEELRLRIPHTTSIDDTWLAQAATTWPALRALSIQSKTQTTLLGLIPLVRRCPNLVELDVSAHWKPFDVRLLGDIPKNIAITQIKTWDVVIDDDVLAIFRCLVTMFPMLDELQNQPDLDEDDQELVNWRKLQSYLTNTVVGS
ncbi:hypothetical protein DXG01_004436 [Tephrocybe rancida]|nr:hypothetical protein DXG01_004436 [Tephrocybe rancida]